MLSFGSAQSCKSVVRWVDPETTTKPVEQCTLGRVCLRYNLFNKHCLRHTTPHMCAFAQPWILKSSRYAKLNHSRRRFVHESLVSRLLIYMSIPGVCPRFCCHATPVDSCTAWLVPGSESPERCSEVRVHIVALSAERDTASLLGSCRGQTCSSCFLSSQVRAGPYVVCSCHEVLVL